jgi:hypothetical protein
MDAVTKFPPRSPIARTNLLPHGNFSFEYSTKTPAVRHAGISLIANDHLSSLEPDLLGPSLEEKHPRPGPITR